MKILCVTFFTQKNNVGGGFTPALAMSDWLNYLGHEAYCVGVAQDYGFSINNNLIGSIIDPRSFVNFVKMCKFDLVFFATPPYDCDYFKFNLHMMEIPYIVMTHGELDYTLYPEYWIDGKWKFNHKCVLHLDIDINKKTFWYPCCQPKYLVNEVKFNKTNGIVYAARMCNWINVELYVKTCIELGENFDSYLYGYYNNKKTEQKIENYPIDSVFKIYDKKPFSDKHKILNGKTNLFWDVIGNSEKKVKYKRMGLGGFEAIGCGHIPIVSKDATPEQLSGMFIEIDPINDDSIIVKEKILEYISDIESREKKINKIYHETYCSFDSVKNQIEKIICIGGIHASL